MATNYLEANPWNADEDRRYGNTRRLFSLAADLGYKFDWKSEAEEKQCALETYESVQMLDLMSDITLAEDKLYQINREIGMILMDRDTHDLTSLSQIENRLSQLASLSSHLGDIVEKKDVITSRLQQPYSSENLMINSTQHKNVVEFFTMISPILSDLGELLETISWVSHNSKDFNSKSDKLMVEMNSTFAAIEAQVSRLSKLRETISSLSNSCKSL